MDIKHNIDNMQFDLYSSSGEHIGYIKYDVTSDGDLRAISTKVFPQFEGNGYAAKLLDSLVDYAVSSNKKIIPVCSYVVAAFKKYPDKYAKVMAE